jgi:hypothetical protein
MPQAGASARPRRNVVPWWEELDSEAFREFRAAEIASAQTRAKAEAHKPPVAPPEPRPERQVSWAPRAANGRRTVYITGRGVERSLPVAERNLPVARPTLRRHERAGFKPDRTAMWAVLLGLLLIAVAATSAHAAVLAHLAH